MAKHTCEKGHIHDTEEKAANCYICKRKARRGKPWTEAEDNRIRELHKTNTYEQIGVLIGRQKGSVFTRMKHLGLSRPVEQPSRIGEIIHPRHGVLVHIGKYGNSMK